jgi:DNA-damage-inducible protein D
VLQRVRDALANNGENPSHHIARTGKMVVIGSGAEREAADFFLTRAACYLLAMNGDPAKPEIADAQAYFAVQTRRAEIRDEANERDFKRLESRERVRIAAKRVAAVALDKGVQRFPLFQNARYEGLYEMSSREVHAKKGVPDGESLLDHAGPLELAAHAFQMELATEKLSNDLRSGEAHAINTNRDVARSVRQTMIDEVGHGPEKLPLEGEPIKAVEARTKKSLRGPN